MAFWVHCSLLIIINEALTTVTYTTASISPLSITCDDGVACEITCIGDDACTGSTIDAESASSLTIVGIGDYVLQYTDIYCPLSGVCDVTGAGKQSLHRMTLYAESSTKLILTADGGHQSLFLSTIKCPINQAAPSCIIRLRSDSSQYWSSSLSGPIIESSTIIIYSADEVEFQCDANTNWDALFGINIDILDWNSNCNITLDSYSSTDFFATNNLICGTIFNNKRCVSWSDNLATVSPETSPSSSPESTVSKFFTNLPTLAPTKAPTDLSTKLPAISPTASPTNIPSLSPILSETVAPTISTGTVFTTDTIYSVYSTYSSIAPYETGKDEEDRKQNKSDHKTILNNILIAVLILVCLIIIVIVAHKYLFAKSVNNMNASDKNVEVKKNIEGTIRNKEDIPKDNILEEGEFVVRSDSDSHRNMVEVNQITDEGPANAVEEICNEFAVGDDSTDYYTQTKM